MLANTGVPKAGLIWPSISGVRLLEQLYLQAPRSDVLGPIAASTRSPYTCARGKVCFLHPTADTMDNSRAYPDLPLSAEEQLRLLTSEVQDYAFVTFNPENRVTSWSAGADTILG